MIYVVNTYDVKPTYFVTQDVYDQNPGYELGFLIVGSKADAEALLPQKQIQALNQEAVRFSICAVFTNGSDTTWREIKDTDPEDTACEVFDTFTGVYTQVANKTEAHALNEQKKLAFLEWIGLDKVYEISNLPQPKRQPQPVSEGTQNL